MSKERSTYFLCNRRDVPVLVKKAEAEAISVLKDCGMYYKTTGTLEITIEPEECFRGYSIGGSLTWNGRTVIKESDCSLIFLQLNNMVLNRMLELGIPSFSKGALQ